LIEDIPMATPSSNPQPAGSSGLVATSPASSSLVIMLLAWLAVGTPLLWGVIMTFKKALALFA
jgi:hypothetical protein